MGWLTYKWNRIRNTKQLYLIFLFLEVPQAINIPHNCFLRLPGERTSMYTMLGYDDNKNTRGKMQKSRYVPAEFSHVFWIIADKNMLWGMTAIQEDLSHTVLLLLLLLLLLLFNDDIVISCAVAAGCWPFSQQSIKLLAGKYQPVIIQPESCPHPRWF